MLKNEELLNANQVAAILNCHVTQVYKMIKVGQLPPMIKFGERMSRMSRLRLEEYLQTHSQKAEWMEDRCNLCILQYELTLFCNNVEPNTLRLDKRLEAAND